MLFFIFFIIVDFIMVKMCRLIFENKVKFRYKEDFYECIDKYIFGGSCFDGMVV